MKKIILSGLLFIGYISGTSGKGILTDRISFASEEKARELLTQEDEFTESWSQFDIDARKHQQNSTKAELIDFIAEQVREWTQEEKNKILSVTQDIDRILEKQGYHIGFPDKIFLVKTTAEEEGGAAAYTRANYVVLKEDILSNPDADFKKLFIHELFHILTRNNQVFKKEMYGIIGFELMNPVKYPDDLKPFRITNPDSPQTDSYITLKVDGEPVECMMIIYAGREYDGGNLFDYLNFGFLKLKGDSIKTPDLRDHKSVIYSFQEVTGFFEQVGKNTRYIVQPEEILADNFVFAMLGETGLPDQKIVEEIQRKLRE